MSNNDIRADNDNLPKCFFDLHSVGQVENAYEALSILLHSCMLDVGFLPLNTTETDIYKCMPRNWKTAGAFKFQYSHKTCFSLLCWMTCIPLYSHISFHGHVDGGRSNNIQLQLKTAKYVKELCNFSDTEHLFSKTRDLVKKLKDKLCFPLLAILQEKAGCDPTFGLGITVDEVKLYILKLLPIKSVISLAAVNKDFQRIAKSPLLWKHLMERDFKLIAGTSNSSVESFKELYKKEYLRRQRIKMKRKDFLPPYYPIFPGSSSNYYIDPRRDLDPAVQLAFPHLRDRFQPNYLFPPYDPFM